VPREVVFDFVADERHEPAYNPRMASVRLISDEPIGRGSRFVATTSSLGRAATMTIEYTAFDRPGRIASRTTMASMTIDGALRFDEHPSGTLLRWSWNVSSTGAMRALGPVIALIGRRQEKRCWRGLKQLLEAASAKTAA
jgi:hypothetical protein